MKKLIKNLLATSMIAFTLVTTIQLGDIDHSSIHFVREVPDEFN